MEDLILKICSDVIYLLVTIAVGFFIAFLKQKYGTETLKKVQYELETKKELASLAVKFAEQAYANLEGYEKYDKAVGWLTAQANKSGLKFTDDEIEGLIESALRTIKDSFGEEWANVTE